MACDLLWNLCVPVDFQKTFHILFYRVVLFKNYLFVLPYLEILIFLSIL